MKIFGIAGRSGMGKTTLLERLIPELSGRGLSVSLIKHSRHIRLTSHPGQGRCRARRPSAGARPIRWSAARWSAPPPTAASAT
jgi:molybdopterin-guanine dinucleotide biosynthesis adapter protein